MSKTHKKCKTCGISKPIYRFKDRYRVCFACRQKTATKQLEKQLNAKPLLADKQTAVLNTCPICLFCKQPIAAAEKDGAYHKKCRVLKNKGTSPLVEGV